MKKSLAILFAFIIIFSIVLTSVSAEDKGTFGSGLTWEFNEKNGELIISGSGDMPDFEWCYYPTEPDTTKEMTTESTTYRTTEEMTTESTTYRTTTEPRTTTGPVFDPQNYYETTHTDTTATTTATYTTSTTTESDEEIPETTDPSVEENIVPWFGYAKKIKTVTIKDGVTSIGAYAFQSCRNLTGITIPDSVTSIGDWSFANCKSLTSITIPDSVTSIGDYAFYHCDSLTSITIPDSVTSIGASAFRDCTSLTSITVDEGNTAYSSDENGVLLNKDKTELIQYPIGNERTSYTIPDGVTIIGYCAFSYCNNLTSVTMPDSVTVIKGEAFGNCYNLKHVEISNNVTEIEFYAFNWSGIETITIPAGVISLGEYPFDGCDSLTSITVDEANKVYSSDEYGVLFNKDKTVLLKYPIGNKRTSYVIPDGVVIIGDSAFSNCDSLTNITIPDSVTSIVYWAFDSCASLANITVDEGNTAYSSDEYGVLFNKDKTVLLKYPIGNKRTSYVIPDGVTSIGEFAFWSCNSLTNITISDSVTSIGYEAFSACTSLTSITIPDSVTSIGDSAFYDCTSLTIVYYNGTQVQWNEVTIGESNDPLLNAEIVFLADDREIIDSGTCGENLTWTLYTDGELVISGKGEMTNYTSSADVPWYQYRLSIRKVTIEDGVTSIGDYAFWEHGQIGNITIPDSVTSIGEYAIKGCRDLTSITVPESVVSIGEYAFFKCDKLTDITIPKNVTYIGAYAFYICTSLTSIAVDEGNTAYSSDEYGVLFNKDKTELIQYPIGNERTSYTIPDSVTSIGSDAFYYCTVLTSITIPDSVTSIGDCAFWSCTSLTSITIPNGVKSIGEGVFTYCTSLTNITVDEDNTAYSSDENGVLFNKDKTELIRYPIGNELTSYTIPDSVTIIGSYAFSNCTSLKGVTIPDSVISIGYKAFSGCGSLKSITIPDSVTNIGDYAFSYCRSLTSITIPDGVTNIGSGAFYDCTSLTSITIPDSVTNIGDWAFYYCRSLTSITIPDSVTSIGDYAFAWCYSLTSITIGNSVTSIGDSAFYNCNSLKTVYYEGTQDQWEAITIRDGNEPLLNAEIVFLVDDREIIGSGTCGENLTWTLYEDGELVISGTGEMTNVPWDQYRSLIKTVTIGDGVTSICNSAFSGCDSIKSITIPDSVTSIGDCAFIGCNSLTSITIGNGVTSIGAGALVKCHSLTNITVDEDNTAYSSDENGVLFNKDKTELIQYPIGNERTSYTIPDSVTIIGSDAFSNCTSLKGVTIPDSVVIIGDSAFYNCDSLTSITIPDNVTSIGDFAFEFCSNLTSITVAEGNTAYSSDENGVLFNKDKTELIRYPIGNELTSYTIPDSVTSIGYSAFEDCTSLTNITIPDSVTSLGYFAFYNCTSLTSITIPDSVTSIGSCAFSGCDSLTSITIPDSVTDIGSNAFSNCENLTSITISDSVTSLGYFAFYNCTSLTSITIGNGVTSIGGWAFSGCDSLKTVYYNGIQKQWEAITIGESNEPLLNAEIIFLVDMPCFDLGTCGENLIWTLYTDGELVISGTGEMYDYDWDNTPWCNYRSSIRKATIEDGVTSIGNYAFAYCDVLESITIPDNVTSIGADAFYNCNSLTTVYYNGTQEQWKAITIKYGNEPLLNAEIEFEAIPEHDCSYVSKVITQATCTTSGKKEYTCTVCGDKYTEIVYATGHDIEYFCKEPTCTETGYEYYGCINCGAEFERKELEALYHTAGEWEILEEPTCSSVGYEGIKCTICGTILVAEALPMIPHTYEESVITAPTCVEEGTMRFTCTACGDSYDEVIPATGEHKTIAIRKEPTCIKFGTEQYVCEICGNLVGDLVILPKGDHSYGEWTVVKEPTATEDGSKEHRCTVCGKTEVVAISATGFEIVEGVIFDFATNTISGLNAGVTSLDSYTTTVNDKYTWEYVTSNGKLGTGSKAILKDGDTVIGEYTILVYGDTTGDSWYDGQDAVLVSCLANGMLTKDDVSEAVYMAADCNHDGVIDQLDVDLLNQAGTLLANVDQSKPAEVLLETSSAYVEYLDLIDQTFEIDEETEDIPEADVDETPEADTDIESEDTTPEQDKAEVNIFEMIINFIKSIFEMLFAYIPVPLK